MRRGRFRNSCVKLPALLKWLELFILLRKLLSSIRNLYWCGWCQFDTKLRCLQWTLTVLCLQWWIHTELLRNRMLCWKFLPIKLSNILDYLMQFLPRWILIFIWLRKSQTSTSNLRCSVRFQQWLEFTQGINLLIICSESNFRTVF